MQTKINRLKTNISGHFSKSNIENLGFKPTLKVRMAMPLNFPLSGNVMQSISVTVPQPSKKLLISSSDE